MIYLRHGKQRKPQVPPQALDSKRRTKRRDDQNKLNGTSINRLYIIDGMFARNLRIEAWKDVLKVMR